MQGKACITLDQWKILDLSCKPDSAMVNMLCDTMFIETTFMLIGNGPGGLIGITLRPSALKRLALSLHIVVAS